MNQPTLSIAVDLDDVVLDFTNGVINSMYVEFGVVIDKDEITGWEGGPIKEFDWEYYGYTDWFDWLHDRDWLWSIFPAVPGALGGLRALVTMGFAVEIVTAKPEWADPQVARWFGKWRPKPLPRVTTTRMHEPKHEASDADVLVDDRASTILDWVRSDPDRYGILFDQPWNREFGRHVQEMRSNPDVTSEFDRILLASRWNGPDGVVELIVQIDEGRFDTWLSRTAEQEPSLTAAWSVTSPKGR